MKLGAGAGTHDADENRLIPRKDEPKHL